MPRPGRVLSSTDEDVGALLRGADVTDVTRTRSLGPLGHACLRMYATTAGWNPEHTEALLRVVDTHGHAVAPVRGALRFFHAYDPLGVIDWLTVLSPGEVRRLSAREPLVSTYEQTGPGTADMSLAADLTTALAKERTVFGSQPETWRIVEVWTHILGERLAALGYGAGLTPTEAIGLGRTGELDEATLRGLAALR